MGCCCGPYHEYTSFEDPEYRTFPALQFNVGDTVYGRQYPLSLVQPNANATDQMRHFKMVFLGESAVGKSSIIHQKVSYKFDGQHTATKEDYFVKIHRLHIDDINEEERRRQSMANQSDIPCFHCILDIQDTAGSLGILSLNIEHDMVYGTVFAVRLSAEYQSMDLEVAALCGGF